MNNPYLGRVNQQLIFARHQLYQRIDEKNANDRMRNQGVVNAGLWHLRWAYRAYLAELGANYKLEKPELPSTAEELSEALEKIRKHPAEAEELQKLEREGFLGEMLRALSEVESIEQGLMPPAPSQFLDPLALVDITDASEPQTFGFDRLSEYIDSFKELVNRHREHMIEY